MEKAMENKNEKKTYETPTLEIIRFEDQDIVVTSTCAGTDDGQGE